jgi:hypothetical protein
MDEDVQRAIAALDEHADPMHLDQTPAVRELAAMGLRAVEPLTGPLLSDSQETRLHAQRAWEAIVYARHDFVGGQDSRTPRRRRDRSPRHGPARCAIRGRQALRRAADSE